MISIKKRIIKDKKNHSQQVVIDYKDWKKIENLLNQKPIALSGNLNKFFGSIKLKEDPLKIQEKMRNEW